MLQSLIDAGQNLRLTLLKIGENVGMLHGVFFLDDLSKKLHRVCNIGQVLRH